MTILLPNPKNTDACTKVADSERSSPPILSNCDRVCFLDFSLAWALFTSPHPVFFFLILFSRLISVVES